MFKKISLAALAAVSTCAFAQSSWTPQDPSTMDFSAQKMTVMNRANSALLGGDSYDFANLIDRTPSNVSIALVDSLCKNYMQAMMMGREIAMARYPVGSMTTSTTTTSANGAMTTTTTTTTDWSNAWANNMRPMRMVMESPMPHMITYDSAIDILAANVDHSQESLLRSWWWSKASEGQKDVIVKFLKADSRFADWTYYPSTMPRQSSWK